MTARPATLLNARDNVATVLQDVAPGETVRIERDSAALEIVAREKIPLCHKIALCDLQTGDVVIKYGECVGEATTPIARGSCVHVHNMRSRRARPVPST